MYKRGKLNACIMQIGEPNQHTIGDKSYYEATGRWWAIKRLLIIDREHSAAVVHVANKLVVVKGSV